MVDTGGRDRHLMELPTANTKNRGIAGALPVGGAASTSESAPGRASSDGTDLDEASWLTQSLHARAEQIDDLWRQHGLELTGFQGALATHFEAVERAITDLIRARPPTDLIRHSDERDLMGDINPGSRPRVDDRPC